MLDLDGDAVDNHDMLKLPIHGLASGAFTRACLALMAAWLIQMSLAQEKPVPPDRKAAGWKLLFDGKTMEGWKVTDFAGHGDARVREGALEIDMGLALSGVQYTNVRREATPVGDRGGRCCDQCMGVKHEPSTANVPLDGLDEHTGCGSARCQ